jgi:dihydrofolate reductase
MRRVLVQQWVSVDGMVAGRNDETDVFEAVSDFTASDRHNTALLDSVDEVLLGRRTYEEFVQFWPTAESEALAPLINALHKTVASSTLGAAPWGEHRPARIVPDAVEHVRSRRGAGATGTTIVWGSITVMRALLRAELVDELELFVAPVLLGTGTPLLDPAGPTVRLTLRDSETWPGGSLRARYAVPAAEPMPRRRPVAPAGPDGAASSDVP